MRREPRARRGVVAATMRTIVIRSCVLATSLAVAACRGALPVDHSEESPPGSGAWTAIPGEPAWVRVPPANPGHVRAVVETRSNLRTIALGQLDSAARDELSRRVLLALRTIVPAPAAQAAAAAVAPSMRLTSRACRDEVLTRDPVPGNTLATAWGLYEVPIAALLAPVDEAHRAIAAAALERL